MTTIAKSYGMAENVDAWLKKSQMAIPQYERDAKRPTCMPLV